MEGVLRVAAAVLVAAAGAPGQPPSAPALDVKITARGVAPGEVVRLDVRAPQPISALSIRAFEKDIATYRLPDGAWQALIGIDLDVAPGDVPVEISATLEGGAVATRAETLAVEAKEFPTRQLRVAPKFVNPPPSAQKRIDRERRQLGALFRSITPVPQWQMAFVRPIEVSPVSGFGVRSVYNGEPRAPHGGADFASPTGTPILAPGGGTVVLAAPLYFTGNTVVVDHGVGLISLFAHLSRIDVKVGERVQRGTAVGLVGATGRVTGPHLHWTVRLQGARVDPLSVIAVLDRD
jgi:murein DD-endopeptidase MepM/ murein hydrolase activator NlpD